MGGPDEAPVSHGVCAACKKALIPQFLDTLPGAAVLIDPLSRVLSANKIARGEVGRELSALEGSPLEEVIDCAEAVKAVTDTLLSGTPVADDPATARFGRGVVPLALSTRPVKDGVLLLWAPRQT